MIITQTKIVSIILFTKSYEMFYIIITLKTIFFSIWAILIRGTLPRYRFDQLTSLTWKHFIFIWFGFLIFNVCLLLLFF